MKKKTFLFSTLWNFLFSFQYKLNFHVLLNSNPWSFPTNSTGSSSINATMGLEWKNNANISLKQANSFSFTLGHYRWMIYYFYCPTLSRSRNNHPFWNNTISWYELYLRIMDVRLQLRLSITNINRETGICRFG